MKIKLPRVTLIGIDCVDVARIQKALDISSSCIEFADVKLLTSLPTQDARKVEIQNLNSIELYSEFCIKDLVKYVSTDFVLIVQHDGFVLNSDAWDDSFMEYDYVGAPWFIKEDFWFKKFKFPESLRHTSVVGNGGFCLRSKKFLETSSQYAHEGLFQEYQPEDVALCVRYRKEMERAGIRYAPTEIAQKFSLEGPHDTYSSQFGFHGLRWTDISKWIDTHPSWGIVQNLDVESQGQ